jgi:translation elongation factor EF-Tu-like GTPase
MGGEAMTVLPLAAFIEADVRLLTPEQGGRRSGIWSGYRCNCWIGHVGEDGERTYNDATFYLLGVDELPPGASAHARVQPHNPDEWSGLDVGARFELCEGPRVIGDAVIVKLLPAP